MGISQNSDGWTIITPTVGWQNGFNTGAPASASTTMIIFVSNSTGKDSGDGGFNSAIQGSLTQPYRTIAAGLAKLRNNSPDWILLKKGDTWTNEQFGNVFMAGLNATNPMVFSSWDSALANNPPEPNPDTATARPKINVATLNGGIGWMYGAIAVLGLNFQSHTRDPTAGGYLGGGTAGATGISISDVDGVANIFIEDNEVSFFNNGIDLAPQRSGTGSGGSGPISVRRNIIRKNYDDTGVVSKGLGGHSILKGSGLLVEENVLSENGFLNGFAPGSSLNHNIYINQNNLNGGPDVDGTGQLITTLTMRGNSILDETHDTQLRCGGHLYNNLWNGGTVIHNYGLSNPAATNLIDSDVYFCDGIVSESLHASGASPDTHGGYYNIANGALTNVIFTDVTTHSATNELSVGPDNNLWTVTNNISWKHATVIIGGATYASSGYNLCDPTGSNTLGVSPEPYPHPNRNQATYYDVITSGSGSTKQDLWNAMLLQRRGNWNGLLMAESVNDYIRQGFFGDAGMIGSTYAGFTPGIPPTLMAQICM